MEIPPNNEYVYLYAAKNPVEYPTAFFRLTRSTVCRPPEPGNDLFNGHEFYTQANTMEKIKNGDPVLYKNLKGTIYGKPRENKYKGLLYTVRIGEEYYKASASELTLNAEELPPNELQLLSQPERR